MREKSRVGENGSVSRKKVKGIYAPSLTVYVYFQLLSSSEVTAVLSC